MSVQAQHHPQHNQQPQQQQTPQHQQQGGQSSSQGSPPPQAPYPFFLPMNQLAGMASFGQAQSGSVLDSTAAASALSSLPLQYSMGQMPFSAVAPSPSSARFTSSPLLNSPTPAVDFGAATPHMLQLQAMNELSRQFRMPLGQQTPSLQHAFQHMQHQHQQQQQQQQHQQQQHMLSSLAQHIPVSATPLDARISPTLASTATTPVTATATVRSSHPLPGAATLRHSKHDKRKTSTQEATATLRRKKHKEVEIKRRKKINSLFLQLTNELECGPTDKASVLLFALNFIQRVKAKYGQAAGGVELKALTGMTGSAEEERREGEDEEEDAEEAEEEEEDEDGGENGTEEKVKKVKKEVASDRKTSLGNASPISSPASASSASDSVSNSLSSPAHSLRIDPTTASTAPSSEESTPPTSSDAA